jgi:hypothetical protein
MEDKLLKVVIVLSRCSQSRRPFGIRFEERAVGQWLADWAFSLKDDAARREGYDRSTLAGTFGFEADFPGCPSCRAKSCFKCGCGKVGCWDGQQPTVICPWCGTTGRLEGCIKSLSVGGDR